MLKTILAGLLLVVPAVAAEKIVGGPMAVRVSARSATIVCVAQTSTANLIDESGTARTAPALRANRYAFSGLKPSTTYKYDCGDSSTQGSFKTPPVNDDPFEFVVYGDTRTRHDMHRRIVAAVLQSGVPDFIVHTGDLVADGADSAQWPLFFGIERELLRQTAFFPSLGNHERNNRQFYEFFDVEEPYYSFNWGTSHFIVLNSDLGNVAAGTTAKELFWTRQRHWLEDDLAQSQKARFRFVIAHHPPITAVTRRQGDNPEMTALLSLFEQQHVSAGFFGHDHNYQHYLKNKVHYVITGGGGAPLYDVDTPPAGITLKVASTEHFVKVRVANNTAKLTAVKLDGGVLEEFEIQ